MSAIAATIIGALFATGTTLASSHMQSKTAKAADAKSERLAERDRRDVLRTNAQTIARDKERFEYEKQQDTQNRAERTEETAYGRKQQAFANSLAMLNNNRSLGESLGKHWGGR